jgi:hypothetical protein
MIINFIHGFKVFLGMMNPIPASLRQAAKEYLWFLTQGYPQKASLKLVGDKFMLSGEMRQVLYRGISASQVAAQRREKIGTFARGEHVLIDTYNVLFTINNYLLGKHLFISNDGMLRDAGEMRGRIVNKPQFSRSVSMMLELLQGHKGLCFIHYLDEPVSFSGQLSLELNKNMARMKIAGEAHVVKSPDRKLMDERSDAICTSDGVIIDHYSGKVIDLPRALLERFFQPDFPVLIHP